MTTLTLPTTSTACDDHLPKVDQMAPYLRDLIALAGGFIEPARVGGYGRAFFLCGNRLLSADKPLVFENGRWELAKAVPVYPGSAERDLVPDLPRLTFHIGSFRCRDCFKPICQQHALALAELVLLHGLSGHQCHDCAIDSIRHPQPAA